MFKLKKEQNGSELLITMVGILDTPATPKLAEALDGVYDGLTKLTFEFRDLEYLTSAGLRVLLEAQQEMDDREAEMILLNVSDDIMEVFRLTGFDDVLTFG
ncbi:MAG: STAS domain-containing protein [Lachnospiraceae bacterium]|nr:STAS domain-containing protein [Lachnospiraceae bacterium]